MTLQQDFENIQALIHIFARVSSGYIFLGCWVELSNPVKADFSNKRFPLTNKIPRKQTNKSINLDPVICFIHPL